MRTLLCFLATVVLADASAQVRQVVIENADSTSSRVIGGRRVTELFGNVRLREDEARLRADRVIDYGDGNYHFFSNVRLVEEGDTLSADEVRYNRYEKIARSQGRVRLGDGEVVVTAPEGDFNTRTNRAEFPAGVRLVDSVSVMTSDGGVYWTDEKRAEFAGDVRLDSDDTDLLADSLTYFREGRRSVARGRVIIVRRSDDADTFVLSDFALNDDSLGTGQASGDVLVARARRDSTGAPADTLLIQSQRAWSQRSDDFDRLTASGSVSVWSEDYAALADSVMNVTEGDDDRSESRLFREPFIWVDQAQVSGDSVSVTGQSGALDSLFVYGAAFVAQRDSVLDKLQQLKGRGLTGVFERDSLRVLEMTPNAEAVYYKRDDEDQLSGALLVTADRGRFLFVGGEISDFAGYQDIEATYYPVGLIPDPLQLEGLRWRPEDRPDPAAGLSRLAEALERLGSLARQQD